MTNAADVVTRHLIGFDELFKAIDRDRGISNRGAYPPCDIIKMSPYLTRINIAVAGFSRDELNVTIEDNFLQVTGEKKPVESFEKNHTEPQYILKGISYKKWSKKWTINQQLEVQEVFLREGILSINILHKRQEQKPLQIEIK